MGSVRCRYRGPNENLVLVAISRGLFMNVAEGSVEECRYFLILAKDLGYGDTQTFSATLEEVSRLLGAYATAILSSGS